MHALNDHALSDLLVERRVLTREQIDTCLQELAEVTPDAGQSRPTLASFLLAKGLLREHQIEELIRLRRTATPGVGSRPPKVVDPRKSTRHGEAKVPSKAALTGAPPRKAPSPSPAKQESSQELPPEAAAAAQQPDYCFRHYVLTQALGKGEMGVVWKAWQRDLKRWVAVKFLQSDEADELARFVREAQSVAVLSHPNITALYEFGNFEGNFYLVMEYVDGQTVQDLLGRMSVETTVKVFHACALALDHAHRHNIVHRDIKPQNIMLTKALKPYLMDFGLAKKRNADSTQTTSDVLLGTPAYMSPEQAEGKLHRIDRRSDIYSLAATLYAVLAGRPPFMGRATLETLYKVVHADPPPLRQFSPQTPAALEAIVRKAMSKAPSQRYPTAREFAADLQRFADGEPILALQAPGVRRLPAAHHRRAVIAAVAGILVLAAFLIARPASSPAVRPPEARPSTKPPAASPHDFAEIRAPLAEAEAMLADPQARWPKLTDAAQRCVSRVEHVLRSRAPTSELLILQARALLLLDQREQAEAVLRRAMDHPSAQLELGLLRLSRAEDPGATSCFERCIAITGDEAERDFARALTAFLKGHTRETMDLTTGLMKSDRRAQCHWLRAMAKDKALDLEGALADYQEALRLQPNQRSFVLAAAGLLHRLNRIEESEKTLQKYLLFRPQDDLALIECARVKAARRDESAVDLATQAVELDPDNLDHRRHRAAIYQALGRSSQALSDAEFCLRHEPDDADMLLLRGVVRLSAGNAAGSAADFRAAANANPDLVRAHVVLAQQAREAGRKEDFLRHLENALRGRLAQGDDLLQLGRLLSHCGRHEQAVQAYDRASSLSPDSPALQKERLFSLVQIRDWSRVETEAHRLHAATGDDADLFFWLGFMEFRKGRPAEAVAHLDKSLAIRPGDAEGLGLRGQSHAALRQWKLALADYDAALRLDPKLKEFLEEHRRQAQEAVQR
ncbi:MAG: protein kinase [Planctomycetes bacterium]|nr:protein kinase [Planctomycetota bacterium]